MQKQKKENKNSDSLLFNLYKLDFFWKKKKEKKQKKWNSYFEIVRKAHFVRS